MATQAQQQKCCQVECQDFSCPLNSVGLSVLWKPTGWVMLLYRLWENRTGELKDYCLLLKKWQKPVLREGCPGYRTELEGGTCRQGMLKKQQKSLRKGRRSISMMNQAGKGTSYPFHSFFARKAWQKTWCASVRAILKYFCSSLCQKNGIKKKSTLH